MVASRIRVVFLIAVCAAFVSAVQAQDTRVTDPKILAKMGFSPNATVYIAKGAILDQTGTGAPQFGITTSSSSTSQGNSFHPRTSTGSEYGSPGGFGDISFSAGDIFWDAQLDLPSGAVWEDTSFWGVDTDAANDMNFFLFQTCQPPGGPGTPVATVVASGNSTGSAGNVFGTIVIGAPPTIDNDSCIYWNRVRFDAVGLTLDKVRSHWHRQVSPSPAVAFFNDVPTTDFAFQFVEAFAAAGITVGCTDNPPFPPPVYCPDRSVTRREMAVFFAKALGLHFPN